MSDYLCVKEEESMRFECPYDPTHVISKKSEVKAHLEVCRQRFVEKQRAEGPEVELTICASNSAHQIPEVKVTFHESLSQDSNPLSKESGEVSSGQGEKTAEGQQGAGAKPVDEDLKDKLSEMNLEDFTGVAYGPSSAAAEEQVGAQGQAANWDEGWEEECARYQDEEEETEDEDEKHGSGLTKRELEEVYAELAKKEAEEDDKYSDNDDFPGYDPWTKDLKHAE